MNDCQFKGSNYLYGGIIVLFIAFIYSINCIYPYVTDDYMYSFIYGEKNKINGLYDIFVSQSNHYMEWSGRYIVHFFAQFMLFLDKAVFNILNTIHYAGVAALICILSTKRVPLYSWLLVLLTLWCFMPQPGGTIFWLTGSFNYIWAGFITSAFIVCLLSPNKAHNIVALIIAIPAGNTHEGLVMGIFIAILLYSFIIKKKNILYIVSLALFFIGILTNILSPGTFNRLQSTESPVEFSVSSLCIKCAVSLYKVAKGVISSNCDWGVQVCVLLFLISAIYLLYKFIKKKQDKADKAALCIMIGALCNFCIILPSGLVYGRVLFGFCFLSYIAFCVIFLNKINDLPRYKNLSILTAAVVFSSIQGVIAYETVSLFSSRMEYIKNSAINGEKTIRDIPEIANISSRYVDTYCMFPNENQNTHTALLYNIGDFAVLSPRVYDIMQENTQKMQGMNAGEWIVTQENHIIYCLNEKPKTVNILVDSFGSTSSFDKFIPQFIKNLHKPGRNHTSVNMFQMHGKYFATWDMIADTGELSIYYEGQKEPTKVQFNIAIHRSSENAAISQ